MFYIEKYIIMKSGPKMPSYVSGVSRTDEKYELTEKMNLCNTPGKPYIIDPDADMHLHILKKTNNPHIRYYTTLSRNKKGWGDW